MYVTFVQTGCKTVCPRSLDGEEPDLTVRAPPETLPGMAANLDDPVVKARVVRALLILTPFLVTGSYLLAILQNASQPIAVLLAGLSAAMSLGTAACIQWLGSASRHVATAVLIIVTILSFLIGR
jgi:fatty acid desaturase